MWRSCKHQRRGRAISAKPRRGFAKRTALPRRRAWIVATTDKSRHKQTPALLSANPQREFHKRIFFVQGQASFGAATAAPAMPYRFSSKAAFNEAAHCFFFFI